MMSSRTRPVALAVLLLLSALLIQALWMRGHSLSSLLLLWAFGTAGVAWLCPLDPVSAAVSAAPPRVLGWAAWGRGLLGLAAAWLAWRTFLAGEYPLSALWVAAAAAGLSQGLGDHDEALPGGDAAWLGLILLGAAWMRLSHLGEFPVGISAPDESMLKLKAHMYLAGTRETFAMGPGSIQDGAWPFYLEALSMKVFGTSLWGFRMGIALIGIVLPALIYGIGRELLGRRAGLLAAAFMAFSLWPLGISQVNYMMNESLLVALLCLWALLRGLRLGSSAWLSLAGFSFGLCFHAYKSMQLMLGLLPLLLGLLAWHEPARRRPLLQSLLPLAAGALLALLPLLLWAWQGPEAAARAYFSSLNAPHIVGVGAVQHSLFGKMDFLFGRAVLWFPRMLPVFSQRGPTTPATFSADLPLVSPALAVLTLLGLAALLARGRRPGSLFILLWFFAGFLPGLVAEPSSIPNDRRIIMVLPAMVLIAGQGLAAGLGLLLRPAGRARHGLLAGLLLLFFGAYAADNWHRWAVDTNQDESYLTYNRANLSAIHRATFEADRKQPLRVLQTHVNMTQSFFAPAFDPTQSEFPAITAGSAIPWRPMWPSVDFMQGGGLIGQLPTLDQIQTNDPTPREWAVSLEPFYYHAEPLLRALGGKLLADVPTVQSKQGPVMSWKGMGYDERSASHLWMIPHKSPAEIQAFVAAHGLTWTVEELLPPARFGDRAKVGDIHLWTPELAAVEEAYAKQPGAWRVQRSLRFVLPEAWFWCQTRNLPGGATPPLRLRARWTLLVPADGDYRLGASSNNPIKVLVNGKTALQWAPTNLTPDAVLHRGSLGEPLRLKAGPQRLEIEQFAPSMGGNYAHVLRLIWQKPDGSVETLPLDVLKP